MAKTNKGRKLFATTATAALVASAIVPVASAAQVNDFNSISSYAQEAVQSLVDRGVVQGDAKGNFNPRNSVTRAEAATILVGALDLDATGSINFTDVKAGAWYYDAINAAVNNNVFQGQGAGKFNPSGNLTRSEAAIILVNAFGLEGSGDLSEFSDASSVKTWAKEALEIAVANGVMKGDNGKLNPNANITKQDFAVMFYRTENLEAAPEVTGSVKAINNTTVEVTFKEDVKDLASLNFAIDGLTISNKVVKQTDTKTVVLTTTPQTAGASYTVKVNDEVVGSFKGISAVVPTKVELVSTSAQGKLGQQVSVQAKVTVAEGQSAAGIPVTFYVPGNNDAVYPTITGEAYTDANGVATYSYTRYAASTDTVTAYATGDRSKFATGYVFWGVDTILSVTEVTEGATINNGANKTYKVTYKDASTGKPASGKTLNVGILENLNITSDKISNATVNGVQALQLSNGTTLDAAQITTDSKGEATFTVSGANTAVTPIVYALNNVTGEPTKAYKPSALQATASKVTFAAIQAEYTIELTRDGGEVAAKGYQNGRAYNVVVKSKDGKVAANEVVNVALNEDLDGIISTDSKGSRFVEFNADGDQIGYETLDNGKQITVKTNAKGEASFVISSQNQNDYATPVAWIDINSSYAREGKLDQGEPKTVGQISYFADEYLDGAALTAYNGSTKTSKFTGLAKATFKTNLVNQSGMPFGLGYTIGKVSYTVFNTGANEVEVTNEDGTVQLVSPNRSYTTTYDDRGANKDLTVSAKEGKTTSVRVIATGVANDGVKDFAFTAKEATATFTAAKEVAAEYTGVVESISTSGLTFVGKSKESFTATTKFYGGNGAEIIGAANFVKEVLTLGGTTNAVTVTVLKDADGNKTFKIVSVATGTPPQDGALVAAKADLKEAIDAVVVTDYVAADQSAATNAVNAANVVYGNASSTTQQLADALTSLEDALKALTKKAKLTTFPAFSETASLSGSATTKDTVTLAFTTSPALTGFTFDVINTVTTSTESTNKAQVTNGAAGELKLTVNDGAFSSPLAVDLLTNTSDIFEFDAKIVTNQYLTENVTITVSYDTATSAWTAKVVKK